MLLALGVATAGATSLAVVLLVVAVGFRFSASRWLRLAERSRIGARSEDEVRHQLAALEPGVASARPLPLMMCAAGATAARAAATATAQSLLRTSTSQLLTHWDVARPRSVARLP